MRTALQRRPSPPPPPPPRPPPPPPPPPPRPRSPSQPSVRAPQTPPAAPAACRWRWPPVGQQARRRLVASVPLPRVVPPAAPPAVRAPAVALAARARWAQPQRGRHAPAARAGRPLAAISPLWELSCIPTASVVLPPPGLTRTAQPGCRCLATLARLLVCFTQAPHPAASLRALSFPPPPPRLSRARIARAPAPAVRPSALLALGLQSGRRCRDC